MPQLLWYDILLAVALLATMVFLGSRKATSISEEEFLIGGREVADWILAGTIAAGVIGGGVLLIFSEYVFRFGLSALWILAGVAVGTFLMIPMASKFKPLADKQLFYTLPDLYAYEWGKLAGGLSTAVIGVWTVGFILMQLISAGIILKQLTNLPYAIGVLVAAIVVGIYLTASGFRAVVITDVMQYLALLLLLAVLFPIALARADWTTALALAPEQRMDVGQGIGFFVLGALNIVVSADMWQRFYAAKSAQHARRGLIYAGFAVLFAGLLLMFPSFYVRLTNPATPPNEALVASLGLLMPRWLLGFGLVGILSTVIATLDTMVFILGISIGHDMRVQQFERTIDRRVFSTRVSMLAALVVGSALAILYQDLLSVGLVLSTLGLVLSPSLLLNALRFKPSSLAVCMGICLGLAAAVALFSASFFWPNILTPENSLLALVASITGTALGGVVARIRHK